MKKLFLRCIMRFRVWCYRARKIAMIFGLIIALIIVAVPFASAETYSQYLFANGTVETWVRWQKGGTYYWLDQDVSSGSAISSYDIFKANNVSPYNGNYVQVGMNNPGGGTAFRINKTCPIAPGESVMFAVQLGIGTMDYISELYISLQTRYVSGDAVIGYCDYYIDPSTAFESKSWEWFYFYYTNDTNVDVYLFNVFSACTWDRTVSDPNLSIDAVMYQFLSPSELATLKAVNGTSDQVNNNAYSLDLLSGQVSSVYSVVTGNESKLESLQDDAAYQNQVLGMIYSDISELSAKLDNLENGWTYIPGQSGVDPPSAPSDPPPPPDTSDFDDAVGTEDDLVNSEQIQSGLDQAQNSADQAQNSLYNFAAGLSAVKIMFETFEFHPIFSCLLWVSVFLGLFTVLLNLGTSFIRGGKK